MKFEYNPYPKSKQLNQTEKRLPKIKEKRTYKKKKRPRNPLKPEVYKGRLIPTARDRGKIKTAEYNEALRRHGEGCYICGTTQNIEAHHVKFRSDDGRGKWRNIRHLCAEHHRGNYSPHHNADLRRELEALHERLYGPYYWCDEYDLFKMGLIPNTTKEAFEKFMEEQEKEREQHG